MFDLEIYKELCKEDREVTEQMIKDGEISEEDGFFRDRMRQDEILWLLDF